MELEDFTEIIVLAMMKNDVFNKNMV